MYSSPKDYIGEYASSEYFTFLPTHLKERAEAILEYSLQSWPQNQLSAEDIGRRLLEKIAALDLPDSVRQDVPQLVEAYFEYLDTSGKMPDAAKWTEEMPEASAYYEKHLRSDGSVKGETVHRTLAKVGRNDPCPCGSGKKFKKCCIDLLS